MADLSKDNLSKSWNKLVDFISHQKLFHKSIHDPSELEANDQCFLGYPVFLKFPNFLKIFLDSFRIFPHGETLIKKILEAIHPDI